MVRKISDGMLDHASLVVAIVSSETWKGQGIDSTTTQTRHHLGLDKMETE